MVQRQIRMKLKLDASFNMTCGFIRMEDFRLYQKTFPYPEKRYCSMTTSPSPTQHNICSTLPLLDVITSLPRSSQWVLSSLLTQTFKSGLKSLPLGKAFSCLILNSVFGLPSKILFFSKKTYLYL